MKFCVSQDKLHIRSYGSLIVAFRMYMYPGGSNTDTDHIFLFTHVCFSYVCQAFRQIDYIIQMYLGQVSVIQKNHVALCTIHDDLTLLVRSEIQVIRLYRKRLSPRFIDKAHRHKTHNPNRFRHTHPSSTTKS